MEDFFVSPSWRIPPLNTKVAELEDGEMSEPTHHSVSRLLSEIVRNTFSPLSLGILGYGRTASCVAYQFISISSCTINSQQFFLLAGNMTKYSIKYTITLICKASCFWVLVFVIRLGNFIVMLITYFL